MWFCSIEPSMGKIRSLSADSCKHIREVLATDCAYPIVKCTGYRTCRYICSCNDVLFKV